MGRHEILVRLIIESKHGADALAAVNDALDNGAFQDEINELDVHVVSAVVEFAGEREGY